MSRWKDHTRKRDHGEAAARQARIAPVSCVCVDLPIGQATFARCTADVFTDGALTVTSIDSGAEIRVFPLGSWERASVYDAQGFELFSFNGHAERVKECGNSPAA